MSTALPSSVDVVVVGGGNAAFCAGLAAAERGVSVLMLERAPEAEAGGNSRFTAGAFRCVYNGVDDLRKLMPDLTDGEVARSDFGTYTEEKFFDDMYRVTEYRTDPELCEILVTRSKETMLWMRDKGVRFMPIWGRQAYKIDGKFKFWGGLTVEAWGGGPGLVDAWTKIARKNNVAIAYGARALSLIADDDGVKGVRIKHDGRTKEIRAKCVVLAAGGFQANAEMRTRYLGPLWELAKVRGTRFNTGDGIRMALEIDAMPTGNWSGCHAVGWDRYAPEFGDLAVGDNFQKHSYPWGIMITANGERFVDEGADFRNYTYAKYGRVILMQPGQFAWQVFDDKIIPMLRAEYRIKRVTKVRADTLEELCNRLVDVNAAKALDVGWVVTGCAGVGLTVTLAVSRAFLGDPRRTNAFLAGFFLLVAVFPRAAALAVGVFLRLALVSRLTFFLVAISDLPVGSEERERLQYLHVKRDIMPPRAVADAVAIELHLDVRIPC